MHRGSDPGSTPALSPHPGRLADRIQPGRRGVCSNQASTAAASVGSAVVAAAQCDGVRGTRRT